MIVVLVGHLSGGRQASSRMLGASHAQFNPYLNPTVETVKKTLLYLHVLFTLFSLFLLRDGCLELLDV